MAEIVKSDLIDETDGKRKQHITITLGCDNSEFMKALSEVEEKIKSIQKEMSQMIQTFEKLSVSSDSK